MPRKIIHLDLDAFFCAVEERRKPELRGKAFAVGGSPKQRGVVSSCSYAARKRGVRSAMPMARALQLCSELIIVPPDHAAYSEASHQVMERLKQVTPLVEQISIDEAFLDVSDLPEPAELIARKLQERIRDELELPCSLGIATNKLVAKIATDTGKAAVLKDPTYAGGPPNAITVVPAGHEAEFLAPLAATALWGVGPKTGTRLAEEGIHTIGDLAKLSDAELIRRFGKNGYTLARHARGMDDSPVVTSHEIKSISREVTFARDVVDSKTLTHTLRQLAEQVGHSLRQEGLSGSTVKLKLRWQDFTTITRQVTLHQPTDLDETIYSAACELFSKAWKPGKPVRLIGVGVSRFEHPARQLSLWENAPEQRKQQHRSARLQRALDELHEKYGDQILKRGADQEKIAR